MAQHTVLYRNSAVAISAALANMNVVPYAGDNVQNNQWFPPFPMDLVFAAAFGATLSAAQVTTPLLLRTAAVQLRPFNISGTIPTNFNLADFTDRPVRFNDLENVAIQTSNSSGVATDDQFVILMFGDGNYVKPSGKSIKLLMTGTTTCTADAWNFVPLTSQYTLPNATFAVVGMEIISATGICGRLAVPGWAVNGKMVKPGVPVLPTLATRLPTPLYNQPFGTLATFQNTTLPQLELYPNSADTAQTVFLDIVQLGGMN